MNKKIMIGTLVGIGIITSAGIAIYNNKSDFYEKEPTSSYQENGETKEIIEATISADYAVIKPEDLYEYSDIVLEVEYLKDVKTVLNESGTPFTTSEFKINKILKNTTNNNLENTIQAKYSGGTVPLTQLLSLKDESFKEKLGIGAVEMARAGSIQVRYSSENIGDKSLEEDKNRIIFVNYNENTNDYSIVSDKYGMISYNSSSNKAFDVFSKSEKQFTFLK